MERMGGLYKKLAVWARSMLCLLPVQFMQRYGIVRHTLRTRSQAAKNTCIWKPVALVVSSPQVAQVEGFFLWDGGSKIEGFFRTEGLKSRGFLGREGLKSKFFGVGRV